MSASIWAFLTAWHAGLSAVSFAQYALDKRAARLDRPRTPEKRLHLADLLGGWPGGLLARRLLHHKTRKRPFVVMFWLTAVAHLLAVGGLCDLLLTR